MGKITRSQHRETYVIMDKRPLEDKRLSWKAKGILAYLLSKPSNWSIMICDLVKQSDDGKASVRTGMEELINAGYIIMTQEKNEKGHFDGYFYEVFEEPIKVEKKQIKIDFNDCPESDFQPQPDTDFRKTENQTLVINDNNNKLYNKGKSEDFSQFSEKYFPRFTQYDMVDASEKLTLFLEVEENLKLAKDLARTRKTDVEVKAYVKKFASLSFGSYFKSIRTFPELLRRFCDWMQRDRPEAVLVTDETLESKKLSFIKAMTESGKVKGLDKFSARDITQFVEQAQDFISKTKFLKKMEQPNLNEWVLLAYSFDLRAEKRQYLYQVLEEIEISPYKQNYKGIYKAITATAK